MLAKRMSRTTTSPTLKVLLEADRLKAAGVDIVDFGAGEPDFPTPEFVKAAGRRAIDQNFTKYTPAAGIAELKAAIIARYRQDYGVEYAEREVMVTAGGKQALFNIALALFDAGDEVIVHAPYWASLAEQVRLAGADVVAVETAADEGFAIRATPLIEAMTPRTKAVIINSPCNPTGALMPERELEALAEEAARRGIWIIADLCYERLIYDPVPHNLPKILAANLRDRSAISGSASKTYAMTGWRLGWAIGPAELIATCNTIQSHSTSNASSVAQKAAVAALAGPQDSVRDMLDEYRRRRDYLHRALSADPRVRCNLPAGAFYVFPDVRGILEAVGMTSSADLARALLDEARVALCAGEAFAAPGFLRISYATSMHELERGVQRIFEFADSAGRRRVAAG